MAQAENDATTGTEVQTEEDQQQASSEQQGAEDAQGGEDGEQQGQEGADDEVVVTLGGESPTPEEEEEHRAPEWVRELRKSNREKDRRLRELEQENARLKGTGRELEAIVVGDKPTLEGCNYDAADYEAKLEAWHARKREADTQQAEKEASTKKQQEAWQATLQEYGTEKSALKVRDYDDVEDVVRNTLSIPQQGIILHGVEKGRRAALVYALGKNPKKAQELAAIQDPVKFAFAIAKLETQLKVSPRKPTTQPERRVASTVAGAAAVDDQLEKLRAEAAKTGDLSKVLKFKAQQRAGGRG